MSEVREGGLRERILRRALELYNEQGIEYVGVRELARDLGVQAGNISYHFPTKDDIVLAIGLQLRELNDATVRLPPRPSLLGFMEMMRQVFRNHHEFRCLFLSLPKLFIQNPALADVYVGDREVDRRQVIVDYLRGLSEAGFLRADLDPPQLRRLASFCALVARGWIGDGWVSYPDASPEWRIDHYLHIVADHFTGYTTPAGLQALEVFRSSLSPTPDPLRRLHG